MRRAVAAACAALSLVGLAPGCAREDRASDAEQRTAEAPPPTTRAVPGQRHPPPAGFPTGAYTRTIASPPPEHPLLEGRWTLVLNPDGTFELTGPFATRGRYTVEGKRVVFEHDEVCPDGNRGVYTWSVADGQALRFQPVDDGCGPTRQYHLGSGPWLRDSG